MTLPNNETNQRSRQSIWLLVTAVLLGLIVFLFSLYASSYGRFMPAVHGDWASHAATTRAIFLGEDFASPTIKATLNEFVYYPKLAYIAASGIARTFDLSPLQGLSIVVQLSIILACLFLSLRLVTVATRAGAGELNPWAIGLAAVLLFCGSHWLGIGLRDQVTANSFISQAASLALAHVFLFAASKLPKAKWIVGLMVLAAWSLINTHLLGFTWCGLSMILMAFGMPGGRVQTRLATAVAGAAIFGIFFLTSEGAAEVLRIAGTGGDLRVFTGQNLSDYGWMFALFIGLYALVAFAAVTICQRNKDAYRAFVWNTSGFLALGPLIFAASFTVLSKGGNWYPVMKWIYVYFPEFLIAVVFLLSRRPAAASPQAGLRGRPVLALLALAVVFLAQKPHMQAQLDLAPAILAEKGIRLSATSEQRRYPALNVDHPALNYFVARSVLKLPMDGETHAWMGSGTVSETGLGPAEFTAVAPTVAPGETIQYRSGQSVAQRTLTNRWWQLEVDHVWAAHAPARVFFNVPRPPSMIRIDFVPFMPNGPQLRKFGLSINGTKMPEMSATAMDWARPASYSVAVPAGVVKQDGKVAIEFTWDPIVKDDLGIALVAIRYE